MALKRPVPMRLPSCAALAALMTLPACGSAGYLTVMQVDPPSAALYINGKRVGTGDKRPYTLSFGQYDRVFIQATQRGFVPANLVYTEQQVADILATTEVLKITLPESR
jgi:hypothetical protein